MPLQQDEAYQLLYKKDGNTNHIELNQLEPGLLTIDVNMANLDWHIEQERLSFLSGSVMDGMGGNATVNYTLTQDGELKAEITHPEIPG